MRRFATMAPIGKPGPETLGERHDVGRNAVVLRGEHPAGPADAALHLVEDQEDPVLVADRAQPGEKTSGRHQVAAFALEGSTRIAATSCGGRLRSNSIRM